jgi:hypothetical protein
MLEHQQFHHLAEEWIDAWNCRDLDAIMKHYADDVEFWSPLIQSRLGIATGKVAGKTALRSYFAKGLATVNNLRFELLQVLDGIDSVTIYYRRENGLEVAEMLVLNAVGKVVSVRVHYSVPGVHR